MLLFMSFLSLYLPAQDIELSILPHSIRVQNDSLYFRYKIHNNSDTIFVFYNLGFVELVLNMEKKDNPTGKIRTDYPALTAFIYDKDGKLPTKIRSSTWPFRYPGNPVKLTYDEIISSYHGKYIALKQGESIEYERRLYIADIGLEKGLCELQLVYYSINHQNTQEYKQYLKAKNQDIRLKNRFMFEGVVRSFMYLFKNPYIKRDD